MHLWPSMMLRDSFKISYLKKVEWNLQRMKSEKKSPRNQEKLLVNQENNINETVTEIPTSKNASVATTICREMLMVFSCCYCCFCCGACVDQEEN